MKKVSMYGRKRDTRLRMDCFWGLKAAMELAAELSRALSLLPNRRVFRSLFPLNYI